MLERIDLSREVEKAEYKAAKPDLELRLAALQRQALEQKVPVIIVFEGWGASGKGTLINDLIMPLDPRGFKVHSISAPNAEESMRPFLWRFWLRTPARGRTAIFSHSWYRRVLNERVDGAIKGKTLRQSYHDICSFERQLSDDGAVIVKFLLHISKKEQKKRFKALRRNAATAWRVTAEDLRHHKQYDEYLAAMDDMLTETDSDFAPWTIVESHDFRFASLKMFNTVIDALEKRLGGREDRKAAAGRPSQERLAPFSVSILDKSDLALTVSQDVYASELEKQQERLRDLEHEIYTRRVPVVLVFEGWDAAGKGGNIRRLVQELDPRGYEVVPVCAPNDLEKAHHYLWRFWAQIPKAGHITIFDRSWYGRVLVERVEGFCSEAEWRRAYREINEMEQQLTDFGAVVRKFWLHIDADEQLRRFKERERISHKRWKITAEDWRNRKKWHEYRLAVDEMLFRTGTANAPWTVVESNSKKYARLKVLKTVNRAIEQRLKP
jgi:polyphosphate:AMP phosphotransferase